MGKSRTYYGRESATYLLSVSRKLHSSTSVLNQRRVLTHVGENQRRPETTLRGQHNYLIFEIDAVVKIRVLRRRPRTDSRTKAPLGTGAGLALNDAALSATIAFRGIAHCWRVKAPE